jgi:MFS family permease
VSFHWVPVQCYTAGVGVVDSFSGSAFFQADEHMSQNQGVRRTFSSRSNSNAGGQDSNLLAKTDAVDEGHLSKGFSAASTLSARNNSVNMPLPTLPALADSFEPAQCDGKNPATSQITGRAGPSWFVIQVTLLASLGGILFGYDLGVISGALPQLTSYFDLQSAQQEIVVSVLYVGGGFGAALGGALCDTYGRKSTILVTDVLFLLGAIILYAAASYGMIICGRIVVGFAIAVSGIADVSYLHEIAPIQYRGSIVSVNEACIALGFLLAFGVGGWMSREETNNEGWRGMFGISGVVAFIQLIGMWTMPESPTWLKDRGLHRESEAVLRRIYPEPSNFVHSDANSGPENKIVSSTMYETLSPKPRKPSVHPSVSSLEAGISPSLSVNAGFLAKSTYACRYSHYLCTQLKAFAVTSMHTYRRQVYIALFLAVCQQLCGQTNVLSYAPLIFAGGNASKSGEFVRGWATLSIGIVKFAVTCVVIWKVDTLGRRHLLLAGLGVVAVGLLFLSIAFRGAEVYDKPVQGGDEPTTTLIDEGDRAFSLALPGVLLVVTGYSMSFGPLTWLLTSELFPTDIRGRALGASTIITYFCAWVVTSTFLSAQEWLGASTVFTMYFLVTVAGFLFAIKAIPDTGEKNTSEIDDSLDQMAWWRPRRNDVSRTRQDTLEARPIVAHKADIA